MKKNINMKVLLDLAIQYQNIKYYSSLFRISSNKLVALQYFEYFIRSNELIEILRIRKVLI